MKVSKKLFTLVSARALQVIISLVTLKLGMYYLDPVEMGRFYIMLSVISFACFILFGPIGHFINRKAYEWKKHNNLYNNLKKTSRLFILLAFIYSFIAIILKFLGVSSSITSLSFVIFILICLAGTLANTFSTLYSSLLNILGNYQVFSFLHTLNFALIFLGSVTMVNVLAPTGENWMIGKILAQVLIGLISFLVFIKYFPPSEKTSSFSKKEILSFAVPLALVSFLTWTQIEGYRFIIEKIVGVEYLGFLAIGFALAQRVTTLVETLNHQMLLPDFYANINSTDKNIRSLTWNKMFKISLPVYTGTLILIISLSPFILRILGNPKYQESLKFITFGAFVEFFRVNANILSQAAHAEMRTKALIIPNIVGALGLVLSLVTSSYVNKALIPYAFVMSSILLIVFLYITINGIIKIESFLIDFLMYLLVFSPLFLISLLWGFRSSLTLSFLISLIGGGYFVGVLVLVLHKKKLIT